MNTFATMGKNDDMQTVQVKVSRALREYILSINDGSDIVVPDKRSLLWGLVKMHLDLVPAGYIPVPLKPQDDFIRISLLKSRRTKSFSIPKDRVLEINTLFRNYLTEEGQKAIAEYLSRSFKLTFRSYMAGALSNNPELQIKEAILEFCSDHNICMDDITYAALRKDWFRYRKRCGRGGNFPVERENL